MKSYDIELIVIALASIAGTIYFVFFYDGSWIHQAIFHHRF